jgi:glycosyltransferase involved in cell wall biosynthesis
MGKGAALRLGIENANGEVIGVQDADFEYDIEDIPKILQFFLLGKADVVYGSRFKKSCPQVHRTYHYLINRFLTILSNIVSGLYLTDMETCYKFFRQDIIKNITIECDRFGFEPEITAKIATLRCRVMEVPISYFPRNYLEGKKITWKDGLAAIWHIINFNLLKKKKKFFSRTMPEQYMPKNYQWL